MKGVGFWSPLSARNMAEQVEKSLELVGATAIEDKLQDLGWA